MGGNSKITVIKTNCKGRIPFISESCNRPPTIQNDLQYIAKRDVRDIQRHKSIPNVPLSPWSLAGGNKFVRISR